MNVRDEVEVELACVVGRDRAQLLVDAYDHELAEEIRSEADRVHRDGRISDESRSFARGLADLIDPEVEK